MCTIFIGARVGFQRVRASSHRIINESRCVLSETAPAKQIGRHAARMFCFRIYVNVIKVMVHGGGHNLTCAVNRIENALMCVLSAAR